MCYTLSIKEPPRAEKENRVTDVVVTSNGTTDNEADEKFPVIAMSVPPALKTLLEDKAKAQGVRTARYCLEIIADHEQFTLPEVRARGAGLDPEAAKAKAKEKARVQREIVKAALRMVAEGRISRSDLGLEDEVAA